MEIHVEIPKHEKVRGFPTKTSWLPYSKWNPTQNGIMLSFFICLWEGRGSTETHPHQKLSKSHPAIKTSKPAMKKQVFFLRNVCIICMIYIYIHIPCKSKTIKIIVPWNC